MNNKYWPKSLLFLIIFSVSWNPIQSEAFYKKKVLIGSFSNPEGWSSSYNPGDIFVKKLAWALKGEKRLQLISHSRKMKGSINGMESSHFKQNIEPSILGSSSMSFPQIMPIQGSEKMMMKPKQKMAQMEKKMDMGPPWPVEANRIPQKASLTQVRGKILKFIPATKNNGSNYSTSRRENAELEVHVELVQNKTGRVLFEKKFKAYSNSGKSPFMAEKAGVGFLNVHSGASSMDYALGNLSRKISSFVQEHLDSLLLEGEIISIKRNMMGTGNDKATDLDEEILVNLGSKNGVHIGDTFKVQAMSLGMQDPFTGSDLGDIYERTGIIQILYVWDGFSKARSLAGKDFKIGYLLQSTTPLRESDLLSSSTEPGFRSKKEKVPWWDFHGIRTVN